MDQRLTTKKPLKRNANFFIIGPMFGNGSLSLIRQHVNPRLFFAVVPFFQHFFEQKKNLDSILPLTDQEGTLCASCSHVAFKFINLKSLLLGR
jgi:hypothetical protein